MRGRREYIQFEILQLQGLRRFASASCKSMQASSPGSRKRPEPLQNRGRICPAQSGSEAALRPSGHPPEQAAGSATPQGKPLGYFKVHAYASPQQITDGNDSFRSALNSGVARCSVAAASALVFIAQSHGQPTKTAADLERVTRLPLLATLGDLRQMTPEEQINWAFRTLTILQGKLNSSSDEPLVCGFISSAHGEGRSTWINLLVSAASPAWKCEFYAVATRASMASDEMPKSS